MYILALSRLTAATFLALSLTSAHAQASTLDNFRAYAEGQAAFDRGDFVLAYRAWHALAERGDSYSQYAVGDLYLKGNGVQQDPAKAKYWLGLAATSGVVDAQVSLGAMYMRGIGIPVDQSKGFRWTLAAANCDSSSAQWNMALAFSNGMGTAESLVEALKWVYLAGQAGSSKAPHPGAAAARSQLEKSLSQRDVEEARNLAFAWRMTPQCKRDP